MDLKKKQKERQFLDAIIDRFALTPDHICETEEPDFLLTIDEATIGVEITELYLESSGEVGLPLQAIENESRLMIDIACQKAINNNIPPQSIHVRLSRRFLKKQYRKQVSTVLHDYIASNFAVPGEVKSGVKDHLPKEIVYITMCGLKDSSHQWNGPSSGWVNSNYIEGFQSAIVKKEALLPNYLKRCDICWLVTVATHEGGSSFIEWSKELATHDFSAKFERVFFVVGLGKTAYELKLTAEICD